MIEGLRLDVTADEIVKVIDQRIAEHTENAATYDADAKTFDVTARTADEDDEYRGRDERWRETAATRPART